MTDTAATARILVTGAGVASAGRSPWPSPPRAAHRPHGPRPRRPRRHGRAFDRARRRDAGSVGDVTRAADRAAVARALDERWGGLDWLLNNAGSASAGPSSSTTQTDRAGDRGQPHRPDQLNTPSCRSSCARRPPISSTSPRISAASHRPVVPYARPSTACRLQPRLRLELRQHGVKVGVVLPRRHRHELQQPHRRLQARPEALRPADVAAAVVTMLHQPPTAQIDELILHPMGQDA